jgi:hypothetical protein
MNATLIILELGWGSGWAEVFHIAAVIAAIKVFVSDPAIAGMMAVLNVFTAFGFGLVFCPQHFGD